MPPSLRKIGQRFAMAFLLESEAEVTNFIRGYFTGRLLQVTPALLAGAIQNDTVLWDKLPPGYRRLLQNVARSGVVRGAFQKYSQRITAEELVRWMLNPYPEKALLDLSPKERVEKTKLMNLASLIINYPEAKGMVWLEKNVGSIKQMFIEAMKH